MKRTVGFLCAAAMLVAALLILPIHGEAAVYDRVIRLHVLANSDSKEDQALKLTVRDAVIKETEVLLKDAETRDEAEAILAANLDRVADAAAQAVRDAGWDASVDVSLGKEEYPTRYYENLAFPAGEYLSLQVKLGKAEGKNWWCVLFPPLCLSAASAEQQTEEAFLAAGLTGEQYRMIADTDNTKYKLRFKILELAQSIFH
ncbi:MAG: stage II sporulation protein R [Clostridia bacterium]|nr:stage II sporulation protein R [Clostridia bacterium]